MDAQRFDTLARAVAGSGSRRGLLRGLAGAFALLAIGRRVPNASAQAGSLGPGDACWDDSQCSPSVMNYSPLICTDNGFDYDGPLNCCTGEGGACFSDEGCCGIAACLNGSCTVAPAYTTSPAPPYAPSYAGLGDPCQTNDECFAGGLVCDYVGQTDDFRCCMYEGGTCGWDGQCCGWQTCGPGGYCSSGAPDPGDGLPLGAQCTYAAQCSGGGYGVDCADNGGFVPACCLISGQSCAADLDCCMPNNCIGGYCGSVAPSGCSGYWCNCDPGNPYACDPGLSCCAVGGSYVCAGVDQRCTSPQSSTSSPAPPYAPSYAGLGDPCQTNDECFAGGLVCDYIGQTDDFRCCMYEGGTCGWDGQCCGWLTCGPGGYCSSGAPDPGDGLPLGAQCSYAAQCSGGGYGVDCADNGGFVPACCLTSGQSCWADLDCCMPNNCIGGYCGSAAPSGCSGYWCDCNPNDPYACDPGLGCCAVQGGFVCAGADQCGFVTCTGQGCPCIDGVLGNCDYGLECCVQGDPGAGGICGPIGNCYSSLASTCTAVWCDCAGHDPYACDAGLICCGPFEPDARGTCQSRENC